MRELKNILKIITLLLTVIVAGTVGYMIIEKWSFIDSLFMAVITVSTV